MELNEEKNEFQLFQANHTHPFCLQTRKQLIKCYLNVELFVKN